MAPLVYLSLVLSAICGTSSAQPSIASARLQLKNVTVHKHHAAVSFAEAVSDVKGQSEHEQEDKVSGLLKAEAKTNAKAKPPVAHSVNVGVDVKVGIAPIAQIAPIAPIAPAPQQIPGTAKCGSVWVSVGGLPVFQDSYWVGAILGMLGCTLHVTHAGSNPGAVAYAFKAANPHGSLILHSRKGEEVFPSFLNSAVEIHPDAPKEEKYEKTAEAADYVIALPGGKQGFEKGYLRAATQKNLKILCLAWGKDKQLEGRGPVVQLFTQGCQDFVDDGKAEMVQLNAYESTQASIDKAFETVKSEIAKFLQVQQ